MHTRPLGQSGIEASVVAIGTWVMGGWMWGGADETDSIKAVHAALADHELIKIRLRQPSDKKAAAQALADESSAALCGVVGHTVVLYRPDPDEPKIVLPRRGEAD